MSITSFLLLASLPFSNPMFDCQGVVAAPIGMWSDKGSPHILFRMSYVESGETVTFDTRRIDFETPINKVYVSWGDGTITNQLSHTYSEHAEDVTIRVFAKITNYGKNLNQTEGLGTNLGPMRSTKRNSYGNFCALNFIKFVNQTSLTNIGYNAFSYEPYINDYVDLTQTSVRTLGFGCFYNPTRATGRFTLYLPNTISRLFPFGRYAFDGSGIKSFDGNKISKMLNGARLIESMGDLDYEEIAGKFVIASTPIENANGLTGLTNAPSFSHCQNLSDISALSNCLVFSSFKRCTSLVDASMLSTNANLQSSSFQDCTSLVYGPAYNGIADYGDSPSSFFKNCPNLKRILLYNVNNLASEFCYGCSSLETLEGMCNDVTYIGESAFRNCTSLTNLVGMSQEVSSMGNYVFAGCTGLKSLQGISAKLRITSASSCSYTFQNCTALEDATDFKNATLSTYIPNYFFDGCTSIKTIAIPSGIKNITASAFGNTSATTSQRVTAMYSYATTPPTIASSTLTKLPSTMIIYVPASSVSAYKAKAYWRARKDYIQAMP